MSRPNCSGRARCAGEALAAANAAVHNHSPAAVAWRTKALIHYERGENEHARFAFQHYLDLRPRARDAAEIQLILAEM